MLSTKLATGLAVLTSFLLMGTTNAVTCLKIGQVTTASWTNAEGLFCTWTGPAGSNFGDNADGGDNSCNGRCGEGCSGIAIGNVYTQDCFSHDVCSYFNVAQATPTDPNCGAAYVAAIDDFAFGYIDGCSQTNPTLPAVSPTVSPVCR